VCEEQPDVLFFRLIVYRAIAAPTALALTTSLLATNLSRTRCKYHLAAFSASTPFGALASYLIFSFLGLRHRDGDWVGMALLVSVRCLSSCDYPHGDCIPLSQGGSFLYIATALQPALSRFPSANEVNTGPRVLLIVIGMFIPVSIGALLGHGHTRVQFPESSGQSGQKSLLASWMR
jgi:solute carrier family 39 (zinc transporter), member 9